jgi:phosphopantetheinyl transferase (holo-ACP synthase)
MAMGIDRWFVSISHGESAAIATVIAVSTGDGGQAK